MSILFWFYNLNIFCVFFLIDLFNSFKFKSTPLAEMADSNSFRALRTLSLKFFFKYFAHIAIILRMMGLTIFMDCGKSLKFVVFLKLYRFHLTLHFLCCLDSFLSFLFLLNVFSFFLFVLAFPWLFRINRLPVNLIRLLLHEFSMIREQTQIKNCGFFIDRLMYVKVSNNFT
jgi:hypothetical protein